ncbi:MAG: hypothetical protein J6575_03440 [Bifidobacterium sp.]|nr:hypothetical protein [Bifidobacterium sp.]
MSLDSYRAVDITLDRANDWIPPVRLNAGDVDGRVLRVTVTDDGIPVSDDDITARLMFNANPASGSGGYVTMQRDTAAQGLVFTCPIPRQVLTPPSTTMAVELVDAQGHIIDSRDFTAYIDESLLKMQGEAPDALAEWKQAIADMGPATDRANEAAESAEDTVRDASVDIGTVTTLAPGSEATAVLEGTGLQRRLDLGIPQGKQGPKDPEAVQAARDAKASADEASQSLAEMQKLLSQIQSSVKDATEQTQKIAELYATATPVVRVRTPGEASPFAPCLRVVVGADGGFAGLQYDTGIETQDVQDPLAGQARERVAGLLRRASAEEGEQS